MADAVPSRRWYLAGVGLLVAAVAAFGAGMWSMMRAVDAMPRVVMPGTATLSLDAGSYALYAESGSTVDGVTYRTALVSLRCSLAMPGTAATLSQPSGTTQYAFGGREGTKLFNANVPRAGDYILDCDSERPDKVVLAIGGNLTGTVLANFGVAVALALLGVIALVLIYRRRRPARQIS